MLTLGGCKALDEAGQRRRRQHRCARERPAGRSVDPHQSGDCFVRTSVMIEAEGLGGVSRTLTPPSSRPLLPAR